MKKSPLPLSKRTAGATAALLMASALSGCSGDDADAKKAQTTNRASGSVTNTSLPDKLNVCDLADLDERLKSGSPESALATLKEISARADEVIALAPDDLKDQAELAVEFINNALKPTSATATPDAGKEPSGHFRSFGVGGRTVQLSR